MQHRYYTGHNIKFKGPLFIHGVLETLNCLHWELPIKPEKLISILCGKGADILTANQYDYGVKWSKKKKTYYVKKLS